MRTLWKAGIVHPFHPRIVMQEFGHLPAVLYMALDTQRDRLDSLQEQKGAQRRENCACGPLVDAPASRNVCGLAKMIGIDEAVIGRVRLIEHGETRGMFPPGKVAAVDDRAAQRGSVATHELGE